MYYFCIDVLFQVYINNLKKNTFPSSAWYVQTVLHTKSSHWNQWQTIMLNKYVLISQDLEFSWGSMPCHLPAVSPQFTVSHYFRGMCCVPSGLFVMLYIVDLVSSMLLYVAKKIMVHGMFLLLFWLLSTSNYARFWFLKKFIYLRSKIRLLGAISFGASCLQVMRYVW